MKIKGVYLPVITPFYNNKIDFLSYKKLIHHYIEKGITGIIPNGTIFNFFKNNNHRPAIEIWKKLTDLIPLLFEEPNPAPIKYMLKKQNLIKSDEVRLPLTKISKNLIKKLDKFRF
ncbi:MAG: dihydrodipicolinate synthase family protein [Chitinispirillia bacterium]|jgi:dihydrodipicolinate synthase/N-acetylneuraminate lyase